jgi:uncharacterized protein (DUF58 family)
MTLEELLKKIRQVEIKSRLLSDHIFAGDYHSAYKGRGMSFAEVREYAYGDDVRAIDWNVSARSTHPYIKVFEEERDSCMMLLIDISASNYFGTKHNSKRDIIIEIAATLAFSATKNNDKIGAIFFSDKIEKYIAPKKGKAQVMQIIKTMLVIEATPNAKTNLGIALQTLNNIIKQKSIVFIVSDFIGSNFENEIKTSGRKHNITGLHIYDDAEKNLPSLGFVHAMDLETKSNFFIDASNKNNKAIYLKQFENNLSNTNTIFKNAHAKFMSVATNDNYVQLLHKFFKQK